MRDRMIRTKFWESMTHPDDPWARLLFIAMWNYADDWGVGTCSIRGLLGFAFPNDDNITERDIEMMLRDIGKAYGVVYYTVSKRPFYAIPSWPKHQKVDHPSKTLKNPGIEDAETWLYRDLFDLSGDPREEFERVSRESRLEVEVEGEVEREVEGKSKALARTTTGSRGCTIPPDFMPSPGVVQAIKAQLHVDDSWLTYHHQKFCDFWLAKTGANATKKDWDATWRNWMRTEVERNGNRLRSANTSGQSAKVAGWADLGGE